MSSFKESVKSLPEFFKKTGTISIITSIAFGVLGLILMINPQTVLSIIFYLIGALFLVAGALKLIAYFANRGKYDLQNQDLAFGFIAVVAGLVVILGKDTIAGLLGIVIGIWIIYSGLIRLGLAFNLRKVKSEFWIIVTILAAIMVVCGIYMLADSNVVVTTIGLIMLIYAIIDLIESIIYIKTAKNLY